MQKPEGKTIGEILARYLKFLRRDLQKFDIKTEIAIIAYTNGANDKSVISRAMFRKGELDNVINALKISLALLEKQRSEKQRTTHKRVH